ncbi:MAG: NmrA family NAD(P)-binding protein [Pseudomonadota bacterium]
MSQLSILVAGATGQIGSHIIPILLAKGHKVRALVRRADDTIHGVPDGMIEYAVGSLDDKDSLIRALKGIHTVVSSANAIIPSGTTMSVKAISETGYDNFVSAAEAAGVRHWVQSSVPAVSPRFDATVPELAGKRIIEARLERSTIAHTIVRNPAFMDVWMVMTGAGKNAANNHPHATTGRPYGFMKMWLSLTGNLVAKRGILLAPGGRGHGSPFIAVEDVANLMAGVVGKQSAYNRTLESGGPEWVTWGEVAELMQKKTGRKIRVIPMPGWIANVGSKLMKPIWPSASNILALVKLVATHQPDWRSAPIVSEFDLPKQMTLSEYLDRHWSPAK